MPVLDPSSVGQYLQGGTQGGPIGFAPLDGDRIPLIEHPSKETMVPRLRLGERVNSAGAQEGSQDREFKRRYVIGDQQERSLLRHVVQALGIDAEQRSRDREGYNIKYASSERTHVNQFLGLRRCEWPAE